MAKPRRAVIAGIVAGVLILGFLAFLFGSVSNFDRSKIKVAVISNKDYLTEQVVNKAVDAALSDITTKIFLARFDNTAMGGYVTYHATEDVQKLKIGSGGKPKAELSFLPDSKPVISVSFDSGAGGAPSERPGLSIFLEPQTYKVYGVAKSYWT